MAVAIHLGKTSRMDYKYKDFCAVQNWVMHGAWVELHSLPKFSYRHFGSSSSSLLSGVAPGSIVTYSNDDFEDAKDEEEETSLIEKVQKSVFQLVCLWHSKKVVDQLVWL